MVIPLHTILFLAFFTFAFTVRSQSFYKHKHRKSIYILGGIGLSSYSGELSARHHFKISNPNVTLGAQLSLSHRFRIRTELVWYRISGADRNSDPSVAAGRVHRNLSFTADNLEWNIAPVIYLFPEKRFSPPPFPVNAYFTAGVGVAYFTPTAIYQGKRYKLRPMKTEGITYGQFTLVLPVGMGLKYKINNYLSLALEANYRFTLTDYLDDVSTVYAAQSSFADPVASILADRRQEIGFSPFQQGRPRGNPKTYDGYLILGLKASYNLTFKNNYGLQFR